MKQEPRIVHSDLTDQWYIVTRYSLRRGRDENHALLVAHQKYDVTAQMEDILAKAEAARKNGKLGGRPKKRSSSFVGEEK